MKKYTKSILILAPLFTITLASYLNFSEFSMGSPATMKNLIVTIVYVAMWIVIFRICIKTKNRIIMWFYFLFWIVTLILALLTIFVMITEGSFSGAIPFSISFLTQWYGINYFVGSPLISSILVSLVAIIMVITALFTILKWRTIELLKS